MAKNPRHSNGSARRKLVLAVRSRGDQCGICRGLRGPIRYDEPSDADHPLSFVLDEVHPIRLWREYGYPSRTAAALDPSNVQAAHWICNAQKGGKDGFRITLPIMRCESISTSRKR